MPTQLEYIADDLDAKIAAISFIDLYSNFGSGFLPGITGQSEVLEDKYLVARIIPNSKTRDGNTVTINFTIPDGEAALPFAEITAVDSSQTLITFNDASLFNDSDEAIELMIVPNSVIVKIIDKLSNTITIDRPLGTVDAVGLIGRILIAQVAIIIGGTEGGGDGQIMRTDPFVLSRNEGSEAYSLDYIFEMLSN